LFGPGGAGASASPTSILDPAKAADELDVFLAAQKYTRQATAALQFYDKAAAIYQLEQALRVLRQ
jgi:hypothetical protein